VVSAILVAMVFAVAGFALTASKYQSVGTQLLLPSAATSGDNRAGNPYTSLGSGLEQTASVLALTMNDETVQLQLVAAGNTASYVVVRDTQISAPVLLITVTGKTQAVTANTLAAIVDDLRANLQQLQDAAGAPKNSYITLKEVTRSPTPVRQLQAPIRMAIIGGVVGLLLGLLPIMLLERRDRRRRAAGPTEPSSPRPGGMDPGGLDDAIDTEGLRGPGLEPHHVSSAPSSMQTAAGTQTGGARRAPSRSGARRNLGNTTRP
jgi:hypothetical protein